jgi:tRNA-2-methylthio-N6-dimethylallyladenosine synthase
VLTEVAGLADQGVKEVTLLGQNVNAYRGPMGDSGEIADFALLLEYVPTSPASSASATPPAHPNEFTPRLIEVYRKVPKLVSHLHLPVQHGSDRILMAMKRGYTALEYKSIIRKLRAVRPGISLSQRLHRRLSGRDRRRLRAHDEADRGRGLRRLVQLHLQPAPRHAGGRPADDTPHEVKLKRLQHLQALIEQNVRAISASRVGTRSASWWKARRGARRRRADGPHRMQPHRQLRRRAAGRALVGQMIDVRHHRGAAAFAARPRPAGRRPD